MDAKADLVDVATNLFYMENSNQKLKIILLIVVVIAIITVPYYIINYQNKNTEGVVDNNKQQNKDIVKLTISKIPEYEEALLLAKQKQFKQALDKMDLAMAKADSIETKSVVDISKSSIYFQLGDNKKAVEEMKRIGDDTTYPASVRASALNKIMSQYRGTKNPELLKAFNEEVQKATSTHDIELKVYTQINSIYPSGIAVSFLAIEDIKKLSNKEEAKKMLNKEEVKKIYDEAISKIERDILVQDRGVGSNYIVPNLILAKTRLMKEVVKYEVTTSQDIYKQYERAITESKAKLDPITEAFSLILYLDYMSMSNADNDKMLYAFNLIRTSEMTQMVKTNLKSKDAKANWPGIVKYMSNNKDAKQYFSKFAL